MSEPPHQLIQTIRGIDLTSPPSDGDYVARGDDRFDQLKFMVESGERPRVLLHGAVGVGKSTELARWAKELGSVAYVGVVDLSRQTRGVLGSAERASAREAGAGWSERARTVTYLVELGLRRSLAEIAASQAKTWTDIARSVSEASERDIKKERLVENTAAAFHSLAADLTLEDGQPGYFSGLFGPLAQELQRLLGRPLMVFVDGLDLLPLELVRELTGPGSPLTNPDWPGVLYVVPHALISSQGSMDRDVGFKDDWHVPPFPIFADAPRVGVPGGESPGVVPVDEGTVASLVDALRLRLADDSVMSDIDANLREIVLHGGGIPRDMLRILRSAGLAALRAGQINQVHVGIGVRELRQDLEKACGRASPVELRAIFESGHHGGRMDLVARNVVLAYELPDRRVWLPHPALWSLLGLNP